MNTIRVSCAALCRIEIEGKFLLEINKNRGNVLTPLGGALEFYEEARPFLESLGTEFQKGKDLRLILPMEKAETLKDWFAERRDRETDALRELEEELLEEHGLALPVEFIRKLPCRYLWTVSTRMASSRKGQEGVETWYLFEVFEIMVGAETNRILGASVEASTCLRLLKKETIESGVSEDGIPVGENVAALFTGSGHF